MYLNSNPKALDGIPLLKGLMGGSAAAGNPGNNNAGNDTAASFTPKAQQQPQAEASSGKMQPKRPYSPTVQVSQRELEDLQNSLIPFFPPDKLGKVSDIFCLMYRQQHLVQEIHGLIADSFAEMQARDEEMLAKQSTASKAKEPAVPVM